MTTTAVNIAVLEQTFAEMEIAGVKYKLAAKAPYLDIEPSRIEEIDCSGFVRYAIYKATDGKLTLPDGSQNQREWCEKNKLMLAAYPDVQGSKRRSLYIAFIKPKTNGAGPIGHVWFVTRLDGDDVPDTMESHGGAGVASRRWDALVLKRHVHSCFEVPIK